MVKRLPPRPNLDHLRRQAKALLAAFESCDKEAIDTFRKHLPAAAKMTLAQVRKAGFRLADAQSAIARKTGFANWPKLASHVEQLRALEGTWEFDSLEVDGRPIAKAMLTSSRVLIDGDRFRSEMGGTNYEGVFNIDVEKDPHAIDFEFVSGPEAGNWNYGIFELAGDSLKICLDMGGQNRPPAFRTTPGSHCALEILRRASATRPDSVTGGTPQPPPERLAPEAIAVEFAYVDSPTLARLQGEWTSVRLVQDGNELPSNMATAGLRVATKNEIKVTFGGQMMLHALVRIHEDKDPIEVDYCLLAGPVKGVLQFGIMKWIGDDACFCMASPRNPRPTDFSCAPGNGQSLSQWRLKKD
jgi:uncharacterized protein (TIGR03067 family)